MFGYVRPDIPNMYIKDKELFKAFYCGLCKSIGKCCGTMPRLGLSYDMAFVSALIHNIAGVDVEIKKQHCILHHITKVAATTPDELSIKLGALNTAMVYYKLADDIVDGDGGRFKMSFFKSGYKKCKNLYPEIDEIVKLQMLALGRLEGENCDSIDRVADCFSVMMQDVSTELLKDKATEYTKRLFYNLGKWVYLIDALDDYDKDIKNKSFNVFYNAFKYPSQEELLENCQDLNFIFNSLFYNMGECISKIEFAFNHDLTDNIILKGLPKVTKQILTNKKCKCDKKLKI